jgi:radical SAM superfamily enzyme YgiQ (UPF0313 family)
LKILLVQSPISEKNLPLEFPVGILALAAFLKRQGHNPFIVDLNLFIHTGRLKLDRSFYKQSAKLILSYDIDLIGFSAWCHNLPATMLIAKECKRLNSNIKIVLGGPEVTFHNKELFSAFPELDIIVRGEGEITLTKLLEALEKGKSIRGIAGITFRGNRKVIENPDRPLINNLNSLPPLDLKLLPRLCKYELGAIEAGRGCPYSCIFCSSSQMWKHCFRIKSPRRIALELLNVKNKLIKFSDYPIVIYHDHLLSNRNISNVLLNILFKKDVSWFCASRLDSIDNNLIKNLKKAGCRNIFIGIETVSPKTQKYINKRLDLSILPSLLNSLYKNDLPVSLFFIIGFPQEKEKDIDHTLSYALICKLFNPGVTIRITLLALFQGSLLLQKIKNNKWQNHLSLNTYLPTVANPTKEISLIKKYPRLFPYFYHIKSSNLPYNQLHIICCLFNFLCAFFPISSILMLRHFSIGPYKLAIKMATIFKQKGFDNWVLQNTSEDFFNIYIPYFKDYVNSNCPEIIKAVTKHEEMLQRIAFLNINEPSLRTLSKIQPLSILKINLNVIIGFHEYDFNEIFEVLKAGKYNFSKKTTIIAYIPGETAKAVSLSPLTYQLLQLSNGKRSIKDIFDLCLEPKEQTKKAKKIILNKFRFMHEQGIISSV